MGNGGNPCQLSDGQDDNSNFIENIFWSNNFMFNKVNPFPRINSYNFAINDRCYDIEKVTPMYSAILGGSNLMSWTAANINSDTAQGMPFIH